MKQKIQLTPQQQADAKRLLEIWGNYRLNNKGATQEALAGLCGWKTQSAVSQYMRGTIPLNLEALLKFSKALGVLPEQISPDLSKKLNPSHKKNHQPEREGNPSKTGEVNNNFQFNQSKSVPLPPTEGRLIDVDYICELEVGVFKKAVEIKSLNKKILCVPHECSDQAFAIVYTGTGMGEILDHGEPLLLDKQELIPSNKYMLEKDKEFMLTIFESESDFGQIFRKKGSQEKIIIQPMHGYSIYKVVSVRGPSDVLT